ncbi:hypothetical protein [Peribacillus glennii]|uniref:Uncharacterized protein n=1 Tax=Peribacillus glennii TaxID=2303991 RepID=A0A372L8K1_9BACI|nr:hypothetical protein [Peribacillus glennii]RFU61225.1 hypothetical protein D0466_18590 [Peribacillus glennii]
MKKHFILSLALIISIFSYYSVYAHTHDFKVNAVQEGVSIDNEDTPSDIDDTGKQDIMGFYILFKPFVVLILASSCSCHLLIRFLRKNILFTPVLYQSNYVVITPFE